MDVIEQICAYIHNFFVGDRYTGRWTISDGTLDVPGLLDGQYFRICGSRLNDGVYQYPASDLADETFDGVIWDMRVPKSFQSLVSDIEAWQTKYGDAVASPYQSESFGGYSYSKASGSGEGGSDIGSGWQNTFRAQLNQYRKLA